MDTGNNLAKFTLPSTNGSITLPSDRWTVLYVYEGDFLPVSAGDILELDRVRPKFSAHETDIVAMSGDSVATHLAWIISLKNQKADGRPIDIELVSDRGYKVLKTLGLDDDGKSGTLIIDPVGNIRAYNKYDNRSGLNVTELERQILAFQEIDRRSALTPTNWTPGDRVLNEPPKTRDEALNNMRNTQAKGGYCTDWYICFTEET